MSGRPFEARAILDSAAGLKNDYISKSELDLNNPILDSAAGL